MKLSPNRLIIIGAAGLIIVLFILILTGVIPGRQTSQTRKKITLNIAGFEKKENFGLLTNAYQKASGTTINYTELNQANYEENLLNLIASGKGPDIFMFHNSWLPKHQNKVSPAPAIQFSLNQLKNLFPEVMEKDFVNATSVYALPLYIDTLALFYNRDTFNARSIALPPSTWTELKNIIPSLRVKNGDQIMKGAAAIGGSEKSVDGATDLLSLIMIQFGCQMNDNSGGISFDEKCLNAFNFYLQFSDPSNPAYSWNDMLKNSLDSFSEGNAPIIFNYASKIPVIKDKSPFLNFDVSPMLQFDVLNPINYADYWGLAVSNLSQNKGAAWNFIVYTLTNPGIVNPYLAAVGQAPALRSLIETHKNDNNQIRVFTRQVLTAKSWRKPDNNTAKTILSNMIQEVLSGRLNPYSALGQAASDLRQ